MLSLGEIEVTYIASDLKSRGIVSEDLRDNLLDHLCCIIENEITVEDNFYEYYEAILPRFFNNQLSEIQIETDNLLKFKNFYIMKKILKFSGISTVAFTVLGALFKSMHWPGATLFVILGGFSFSIIFMPLLILLKFKDEESKTEKVVFSFGLLLAMTLITGLLFKMMHWPYANNLMFYSTLLFTFLFVPIYFITGVKKASRKFNVAVNSVLMLACGGIFYSMFDMNYSRKYVQLMKEDYIFLHQNTEKLMASNQRLMNKIEVKPYFFQLHEISNSLNVSIESLNANILEQNSTRKVIEYSNIINENISRYNIQLMEINSKEFSELDVYQFDRMRELKPDVAMKVLARLQQQLALNENCLLTDMKVME